MTGIGALTQHEKILAELANPDIEIDVVHSGESAEVLGQSANL